MTKQQRQQVKSLDRPDELIELARMRSETVELGDLSVAWSVFQPGWRWSEVVRPMVGGEWCQARHVGIQLSGHLRALLDDGSEILVGPREVYVIPPGHDGMVVGDEPVVVIEWSGVRGWIPALESQTERILANVLITDIVGSTATAASVGDGQWRALLAAYNERTRDILSRFRGREVNTTGDGFVAIFDGSARALRCALELVGGPSGKSPGQLQVRAAVHTGEVERVGDDVRGIAVHETARMADLAAPGEVVVSAVTRQLAGDAGFLFVDRGEHELKGLDGTRRLFAVTIGP